MLFAEALDLQMPADLRKTTGIYKLTEKEKRALSRWIENHYTLRDEPLEEPLTPPRPAVSQILDQGRGLLLTDGSKWEVHPDDAPIASCWFNPEPLIISEENTRLTHSLTGSSVRAKRIP